ncbi:MAG: CAP domain-containing protein, partial [Nannocystales bacterium]
MASLRWTSASTVLALMLALPGCYEGPPEIEGTPWDGDEEAVDDEPGDDDGNVDEGGDSDSAGEPEPGTSSGGDSDTGPSGDDSADPPDDPSGDDSAGDDTGDDTGEDPPPPSDEVPDNAYCNGVADWTPAWTELENEILAIVNQRRAEGANCGSAGSFGPAGPVTANPALRCAARVHSQDMVDRNFFDHTNPSGESPFQRMVEAGYQYSTAGENIAAGNSTAAATMQQWMD